MWYLVTLFVFSPCIHKLKRADIHHKIFFYSVVWMRMSMSCTCDNLIHSLKLWSGNMYMCYFISKCDAELWFCTLELWSSIHAAPHQGCWQFWTYMKTLFYHSISYIEFRSMLMKINLYVCSWIFLFSKTSNILLIYPPQSLKSPSPSHE